MSEQPDQSSDQSSSRSSTSSWSAPTASPSARSRRVSSPPPAQASEGDDDDDERGVTDLVEQPAKVMRIGSMIRQLLEEVKAAPLDEASRNRLKEIHQASIKELESGLAPELVEELERLSLPFTEESTPSEGELRIAQAQLVGWLEGLFHGIQTAIYAQQMAARAQLEQMRRQLPAGHGPAAAGAAARTAATSRSRGRASPAGCTSERAQPALRRGGGTTTSRAARRSPSRAPGAATRVQLGRARIVDPGEGRLGGLRRVGLGRGEGLPRAEHPLDVARRTPWWPGRCRCSDRSERRSPSWTAKTR